MQSENELNRTATGFETEPAMKGTALEGVVLECVGCNYTFRYPDGTRRAASMTDVLLWELLRTKRQRG